MRGGMACILGRIVLLSRGLNELTIGGLLIGTFPLLAAEVALGGVGMGLAAPSSSNALLDLLPERAAVVTGIRGVFRSTGGDIRTRLIVVWLGLSPHKAAGIRHIYARMAILLLTPAPPTLLRPRSPPAPPP